MKSIIKGIYSISLMDDIDNAPNSPSHQVNRPTRHKYKEAKHNDTWCSGDTCTNGSL